MPNSATVVRRVHYCVLGAWTSVLLSVWGLANVQHILPAALYWAGLYSLPLLLPLAGLLKGRRRTHAWATLCVLPYLIISLTELVAQPTTHLWNTAVLGCALLLFIALIAYLRVTRGHALPL